MRRVLLGLVVLVALGALSCALLPRYPSRAPRRGGWSEDKLAESMDPWILGGGFADRLVIEVDWVAGCKPGPHTIEGLRATAAKYGPPGRPLDIVLDEEIPRAEWDEAAGSSDTVDPLVQSHAGYAKEPCDPEFRTAHLYVLFAPGTQHGFFGYSSTWEVGDARVPVDGIVVFHDAHARLSKLWISVDRVEATTIVHEFGHQFGLVSNEAHERLGRHGGHCTSLKCLMAAPTWRVYFRNALPAIFDRFPIDYCRYCQEDIRRAQAAWRARLARDPGYRGRRVAKLQAWYVALSLRPMLDRGEYTRVLAEIREARERSPDASFGYEEIEALTSLGRFDEARERWRTAEPDRKIAMSWQLGRKLMQAGRCDEAIALFDRHTMSRMDEYEFEQSAFVLREALQRAGRKAEEIALIDDLLSRGPATSYLPEGMRVRRCELLRESGRLEEAKAAAAKGLGSRRTRAAWYREAAEVADAAGDRAKGIAVRRDWLAHEEELRKRARPAIERWGETWRIVEIYARMGEIALARAEIEREGTPPEATGPAVVARVEIPVLARLGDWDSVAALLQPLDRSSYYDPCDVDDLAPMRADPRYAALFKNCVVPPPCH